MVGFVKKFIQLAFDIKNFGLSQSAAYLVYQISIKIGLYRFLTPKKPKVSTSEKLGFSPFKFPELSDLQKVTDHDQLITFADRILRGEFLAFGMTWKPLEFLDSDSQEHWTVAKKKENIGDIKIIWEPARFDWSVGLAKAYYFTKDEIYYQQFKKYIQEFIIKNPVNQGLNWQSGQEISIRFINLSLALSLFCDAFHNDEAFKTQLTSYLKEHAFRIKPTLLYAYAQNNNHLISEAVGLLTASVLFKNDKRLQKLKKTGVFWLNYCLQHQFDRQGVYLQYSTNYHRMVLDLLIWVRFLENQTGELYVKQKNLSTIKKASDWLFANYDPVSGEMANYGHNDGAYLLQLNSSSYRDARPTLQAICMAYQFPTYFEPGKYDEKYQWFTFGKYRKLEDPNFNANFRLTEDKSWAVLRVNRFSSRPGQADQNHVDVWYQGDNVVCDAGTYSYNLPEPWHNALRKTKVHNTLTVNGMDQMEEHGTFRWRDWSTGLIFPDQNKKSLIGEHNGYKKLGITHTRQLKSLGNDSWQIDDTLTNKYSNDASHEVVIHWLIRDNPYQFTTPNQIEFTFSDYQLNMELTCRQGLVELGIIRAGVCVFGNMKSDPNLGWYSPSYLVKQPALSIIGKLNLRIKKVQLTTTFQFTEC